MTRIGKHDFEVGQPVKLLQKGEVIDEGILRRVGTVGESDQPEVDYESTKYAPRVVETFVYFQDRDEANSGWKMIFSDPMAGGRCFSQRAPLYSFEPMQ